MRPDPNCTWDLWPRLSQEFYIIRGPGAPSPPPQLGWLPWLNHIGRWYLINKMYFLSIRLSSKWIFTSFSPDFFMKLKVLLNRKYEYSLFYSSEKKKIWNLCQFTLHYMFFSKKSFKRFDNILRFFLCLSASCRF